jgi:hypothetical protein
VADHLSPAQAVKTLCHELAQCGLHDGSEYTTGATYEHQLLALVRRGEPETRTA